ncbi:hypothetical protein D9615_002878 [Tricholomella constricta]|uniref:Ras-GEF domain-containing protein n=1 Tax=Tricholomella constricta TaxID=117010 RepID=A0A8H5HGG8_9AGAR|nr:hypothetical protein D9615_002878 [Tricholomella constricta]
MSSPSLAAVSGRNQSVVKADDVPRASSQPISLNSSSARPPTHVKQIEDNKTEKTESIHSDDASPASSGVFVPVIPKFSLEKSFPSILVTVERMRPLEGPISINSLHSLVQVFSTCLRTIVHSMDDLPHNVRLKPEYEVAQFAVIFSGNLLHAEAARQSPNTSHSSILTALELVDMTVASLRSFLKVAERVLAANKPLPKLPTSPTDKPLRLATIEEQPEPLVNIVEEVLKGEECEDTSPSSQEGGAIVEPPTTKKTKIRSGSMIRSIVRRRRASASKSSLFTHRSKSSTTLVNAAETASLSSSVKESFSAEVKDRADEVPYLPRQSAIYYLADPYCPEIDVDMPLPTGDAVAVRLDHNGVMKAASLTALVRILTSKESVIDQEFTPTFFICFRFFTTPALFLDALVKRYSEQPPEGLNPAQLRIWTRNHMAVHLRVGKTILLWLDVYWKPDDDAEVLEDLQAFTLNRLARELPEGMVDCILQGLDLVWGDNPLCRRSRKAYDLEFVYHYNGVPALPPNLFPIWFDASLETSAQLLSFNCPTGREEFARQITIRVSEMFRQMDPEDAVKYWHLKEQKARQQEVEEWEVGTVLRRIIEFERALFSWVTFSVLDEHTTTKRRDMLEFWLDVSARCMQLRNFSGAHCILGGLSSGAITRLKHTVLIVDASSKQQFRALQTFFGGLDNYAHYRDVLSSIEPTVPMLAPLIRDVVSALGVVPTTIGSTDDSTDKNLINLSSYRIITKTVRAMESCLIPYKLPQSDAFQEWIEKVLAAFPSHLEDELNNTFYSQSNKLEIKDEALNSVEPWKYTVKGTLNGKYTLLDLPPPSAFLSPPKKKNRLAAIFRRI